MRASRNDKVNEEGNGNDCLWLRRSKVSRQSHEKIGLFGRLTAKTLMPRVLGIWQEMAVQSDALAAVMPMTRKATAAWRKRRLQRKELPLRARF